ncbi:MAG: hypothetical protein GAK37_02839 [Pseudomonas sp.]|nr:MAG: hypothetical protein GAK37_02839 [Pseudomonas sp.]
MFTINHPARPTATPLPAMDLATPPVQESPPESFAPIKTAGPLPITLSRIQRDLAAPPEANIANAVQHRFATRPKVRTVAAQLLQTAITSLYPDLDFDIRQTSLAMPLQANPLQYQLTPLVDIALDYLASGIEPDFTDKHSTPCKLVNSLTGATLRLSSGEGREEPDLRKVELAIRSLPEDLNAGFASALSRYWGREVFPATSRWQWLGDTLDNTLRIATLKHNALDKQQRQTLDQLTRYPDRTQRLRRVGNEAARAYVVNTTLGKAGITSTTLGSDLLITRQVGDRTIVLHTTPAGVITPYPSLEAFATAWNQQLAKPFSFDHLTWQRMEPDGNIFDAQAATLLNRQLENLNTLQLPANGTRDDLKRQYSKATATAPWFVGAPALSAPQTLQLGNKLPAWLRSAPDADRFAYQRHALALASSVQRNAGRTFLDGIPDIRTYARQQLDAQLAGRGYTSDEVEVVFKVPVGTMGSGYIERVKMSLVDMALENLTGLPKGEMEVSIRGCPIADPTVAQTLKTIICQVDIGRHYPALLDCELLADTDRARERQSRFIEQVPIQLAMQALEFKLKGEAGITAKGYQFVDAVIRPGAGIKQVDGQDITVRPLAFVRKPGAIPDVAANMFLIEPLDATSGPHILYRPQLAPALLEFATRETLLEAIRQPGPVQQSILAWLPDDRVRAVYGNGGFNIPNIARYTPFNEFDAPATPEPTTLAVDSYDAATTLRQDLLNGDLMKSLFNSNARSLVTLAQGQSTSDTESRWASYKELGWLLFNTLLPVLRGPGAMAGWLLQLASVESDIQKASDPQTSDPSAAMVDLLVNVAMLLSHTGTGSPPRRPVNAERFTEHPQLQRTVNEPASTTNTVIQQATPLSPEGSLTSSHTVFDFAFSSTRGLSPTQRGHINSFSVQAPLHPVEPIPQGATQGLYSINEKLHALIDNHWFRVARDLDGVFVIDEQNKARTGPALKTDGQGHWSFDISPKLKGGMRKASAMDATLKKNLKAKAQTDKQYQRAFLDGAKVSQAHTTARQKAEENVNAYESARKRLRTLWNLFSNPESGTRFAAQYEQQLQATQALRSALDRELEDLKQLTRSLVEASERTIGTITPKKLGGVDDLSEYKQNRSLEYRSLIHTQEQIDDLYIKLFNDSNQYAESGAPLGELVDKARTNSEPAYLEMVEAFKVTYADRENLWRSKQAINELFDKWRNDSPFGNKQAEEYLQQRYTVPPTHDALVGRLAILTNLKELSINRLVTMPRADGHFFLQRFAHKSLDAVNRAFLDQREYQGYTLEERKSTLQTIVATYNQSLSDSLFLQDTYPTLFRAEYHELYNQRLRAIIADAEADLAQAIREEQQLVPVVPAQRDRLPRPQNQRVFKTRDKQTLIGTLRPQEPGHNNIIDVLDPQTGRPVASYSEHPAEREWVKIERAQPVTPTQPVAPKALATYRNDAQKLIDDSDAIERTIEFQKRKLNDPQRRDTLNPLDWNDMLEAQANKLREVARQTESQHSSNPDTATLVARWRGTADELLKKARQHTADGYRVQPPKPENVDFLWRHGFVDINLVQRDVPTKSGDVFTEYAVRAKGKIDVLWYAHFH